MACIVCFAEAKNTQMFWVKLFLRLCVARHRAQWTKYELNMVMARGVVLVAKKLFASSGEVSGHGFDPWVRKIPWRRARQPSPVFSPGESHRQRSLGSAVHRVTKSRTWLKYLSSSREVSLLLCMIVARMFIGFRQVTHPLWAFQCSLEVGVRPTCVRLCDREVT